LTDLLEGRKHIYFIGVGGIGMSGLAKFLKSLGYEVSGSDIKEGASLQALRERGINVFAGHREVQIRNQKPDLIVYSSAISKENPEFLFAKEQGLPMIHRAELLARLVNSRRSVAVLGTHGKTTTSSMVSYLMDRLNYHPTCFVGGVIRNLGDNVVAGEQKWIVAEVDESDGSHLLFSPDYAILTNLEEDHLDFYANLEDIKKRFRQFLVNLKPESVVVYCKDCPNLNEVMSGVAQRKISYGLGNGADFTAEEIRPSGMASSYRLLYQGNYLCDVSLGVPGRHNVSNSLAALALLSSMGIAAKDAAKYLPDFCGAKRRLEIKWDSEGVMVVDDYAHHPTEVRASLSALKAFGRTITCVFQPHRYSRVVSLANSFGSAFQDADEVIVTGIYGAGESNVNSVDATLISDAMRQAGHPHVLQMPKEKVICYLRDRPIRNQVVAFLGAGDITEVADHFVRSLREESSN